MMRSTIEIIVAIKECKPVSEEEMRLALMVMSSVDYFLTRAVRSLLEDGAGPVSLEIRRHQARGLLDRMFQARKSEPARWLGPENTPGTQEFEARTTFAKGMFKKATGMDLDAMPAAEAEPRCVCLLLNPVEVGALLAAARMQQGAMSGEGPYIDALKCMIDRLSAEADAMKAERTQ